MNQARPNLYSGEVARLAGLSPDSIRYYERLGVLPKPARTKAGYRVYDHEAVDRVRLIQRALHVGFTLSELSEVLKVRDAGGAPCRRVLHLIEDKLRRLDEQIEQMRETQNYMRQLAQQWRAKLAQTRPGEKAMLLHELAGNPGRRTTSQHKFNRRASK